MDSLWIFLGQIEILPLIEKWGIAAGLLGLQALIVKYFIDSQKTYLTLITTYIEAGTTASLNLAKTIDSLRSSLESVKICPISDLSPDALKILSEDLNKSIVLARFN